MSNQTAFESKLASLKVLTDRLLTLDAAVLAGASHNSEERGRRRAGLEEAVKNITNPVFDVAVVGEMKAGKSTLLNALVFREELLPDDVTTCTAKLACIDYAPEWSGVATFVGRNVVDELESLRRSYGAAATQNPGARVAEADREAWEAMDACRADLGPSFDGLVGSTTEKSFAKDELRDYMARGGRYTPIVAQVRLKFPHGLGKHIRVVDTPGLLDPDPARAKLTMDYIAKASVVIATLFAGQPMSRESFEMLKRDLLGARLERILVALNKIDVLSPADAERVTAYVASKLQVLKDQLPGDPVLRALGDARVHPISGILGLVAATEGKCRDGLWYEPRLAERFVFETYDQAMQLSGLPALRQALEDAIVGFDGNTRVRSVVERAHALLDALHASLGTERAALDARADDRRRSRSELDAERERLQKQKSALEQRTAGVKSELEALVKDCEPRTEELQEAVKSRRNKVLTAGKAAIEQIGFTNSGNELAVRNRLDEQLWDHTERDEMLRKFRSRLREKMQREGLTQILNALPDLDTDGERGLRRLVQLPALDLPVDDAAPTVTFSITFKSWWTKDKREEALRVLNTAVEDWVDKTRSAYLASVNRLTAICMRDYVNPLLATVKQTLAERIRHVEAELNGREGGVDDGSEARDREQLSRLAAWEDGAKRVSDLLTVEAGR